MKTLILTLALGGVAITGPGSQSSRTVPGPADAVRNPAETVGNPAEAGSHRTDFGLRTSDPGLRTTSSPETGPRGRLSLDADWKFAFGNAADVGRDFGFGGNEAWAKVTSGSGPVRPGYNDAGWRDVDLPHDWAVELPFVQGPRTSELVSHGFKPVGRAFPETSIGWYRRHFALSETDAGRRVSLDFDGVFRDCHVWLNGVLLGRHEGGYAPFGFDASDFVRVGDNVLTVRVDATQAEGWFYEGAGIYRHVWLTTTAPVHFPQYAVYVAARPMDLPARGSARAKAVAPAAGDVRIATLVANDSDRTATVRLESRIVDPQGTTVATVLAPEVRVAAWEETEIRQSTRLPRVVEWSLDTPALYRLESTVRIGTSIVDQISTRFGIRDILFDPDRGFFLNGKRVQINGTCNHQDHAGVGAAVPDRLQRYRIERLKEMGVNAYRTSHNPPAPEILDACDEVGMLVMDETRLFNANDLALRELRTMVRRDRNHPSVILWSIGNEEPEQNTARGNRIARTMVRAVKQLDATRPVTYGSNGGAYEGVNEVVDVRGFNYYMGQIDRYHAEHPRQPLFGSEIASTVSTRGEYAVDKARGYLSAYDLHKPAWGELAQEWVSFFGARPWLAGGFIWTGFDYRGEPTPYEWPCINSHFGIFDTCGFPKDLFWYYKSWWTTAPVLHLLPHWNWPGREGQPIDVWAFTNADEVRLTLNGRDLGSRKVERYGHAEWQVPYEAGRLEAIGYRSGREVSRDVVETTGQPATLRLVTDRSAIAADHRDLAIVTVSAVDDRGRTVPVAANDVAFDVTGPGRIIGVGNGDPSSHEADRFVATPLSPSSAAAQPRAHRRVFNGFAQVLVQTTGRPGDIVLRATADGLAPASITVRAGAAGAKDDRRAGDRRDRGR